MTTKEKAENLIDFLTRKYYSAKHNIYKDHSGWDFYFALTGFINGEYFSIYINSMDRVEEIEISDSTDCVEEITKILIEHELLCHHANKY